MSPGKSNQITWLNGIFLVAFQATCIHAFWSGTSGVSPRSVKAPTLLLPNILGNVAETLVGKRESTLLHVRKSSSNPTTKRRLRSWDESYQLLVAFKEKFGNCNVPKNFKDDTKLARWVDTQRQQYKNDKLSQDKIEQLNEIGFEWYVRRSFDDSYELLMKYKEKFGDCNVPQKFEDDPVLGKFVNTVRVTYHKGSLPKWKVEKLNELGFVWNPLENDWWKMYQQLATYHEIHGHCDYPTGPQKRGDALSGWVCQQRQNQKFLSKSQQQALDDLGFTWTGVLQKKQTNQWMKRFKELKEYKRIHGHTRVPVNSGSLGIWVSNQRSNYNNGNLQEDRKELLDSIDFAWRLRGKSKVILKENEERWFAAYDKLVEFKKQHNHTLVPRKFNEDQHLGTWVHNQRNNYKRGKLRNDRKKMLEETGFVWSFDEIYDQQWQDHYLSVAAFKNNTGTWPTDHALTVWMVFQRQRKGKGVLEANRVQKLDEIGFPWEKE